MAVPVCADTIRPFQTEDFARVAEIYNLSHTAEYAGETIDFPPEHLVDSHTLMDLFHASDIFVFDDGEIKGFVGHQNERIVWLYINPAHQGLKIGRRLVQFVMARLNYMVSIVVVKSNQPALNLYQDLGFKVVDEFEFDYQGIAPVKALNLISEQGLKLIEQVQGQALTSIQRPRQR